MKLYLDTNIYDFISDEQEDQRIINYVQTNKIDVLASSTNLTEVYSIRDQDLCKRQLKTLTTVATSFETKPQSWWQAKEVLSEIKRINPHWLRQPPSKELVEQEKYFLHNHRRKWEKACELHILKPSEIAQYKRDFEKGVSETVQSQKMLRQRLLQSKLDMTLFYQKNGKTTDYLNGDLLEPDTYWRMECLLTWFVAFTRRIPESKDYADWLLPYVRNKAFNSPTYLEFWMNRVKQEKVSKNRISSLVSFYQMKQKITHGNTNDQNHACHIFDVDLFLTADRAFSKVLEWIIPYFPKTARIIFIDRRSPSPYDEITKAIEQLSS